MHLLMMFAHALATLFACFPCNSDASSTTKLPEPEEIKSLHELLLALQPRAAQRSFSHGRSTNAPSSISMGPRARTQFMMEPTLEIDGSRWLEIKSRLDVLPVFSVGNDDKKPLQYTVSAQGGPPRTIALFYADVRDAKSALETAIREKPDSDSDLIQVGLGTAYNLYLEGKAMIVPGMTELTFLGMPEAESAFGQELPLLGSKGVLATEDIGDAPTLYMSIEDCQVALKKSVETADGNDQDLEVVGLTLSSVIELLSKDEKRAMNFIPPSRSMEHISKYVGKGVYYRVVDED